jgi:hypothetical protein
MRSRSISDFRFQISNWGALAVVVMACLALTVWADTTAERTKRLASLSPEEKEDLLRKKQRFDALKDEEKQRLRDLHQSLSAEADAVQLHALAVRYSNWLKALAPTVRSSLQSLPADQRIERIKEIVRGQEAQRFREFVNYNLPPNDQEQIYQWLDKFVEENEKQILDAIRDDHDRRRIRNIDDDRARRRSLISRMGFRYPGSKMPFPSKEEINQMVDGLSETTRKELDKATDPGKRQGRAYELVGAAIFSILQPQPSESELRKFYADLPAEKQAPLENLDPEQLQIELRKMFRMEKYGRWGGPQRGGFDRDKGGGGDGRGPRPGPPPPEFNQPPGFASPAPQDKKGK